MDKLLRPYKTYGGINPPHHKATNKAQSVFMPAPKNVTIPMIQHIGASCKPVVKKGDYVYVGQIIGESDAFVSAPVHSSVSGTVKEIKEVLLTAGAMVECVCIESDGEMQMHPDIKPPEKIKDRKTLSAVVRKSGLVGLGGAGFPAHVKLNVPEDKKVDYLIINAAECEPYLTSDHREALENTDNIIDGLLQIKEILKIEKVIIAVESNKPDAIKLLLDAVKNHDGVFVMKLRSAYPQGAEKTLIQAATGRCVPSGKLPLDVGCIVMNIGSVSFFNSYMRNGIPLIMKRVTIEGNAVKNPMNVIVPVGTLISDIIEFTGGYKSQPKKVIMGGPMMGVTVASDNVPIIKQNNGILCFDESMAWLEKTSDCIRCGRCVNACPMSLIPTIFDKYVNYLDVEQLKKHDIMSCMECGCCTFSCPAHRKLVHSIKLGKSIIRKAGAK